MIQSAIRAQSDSSQTYQELLRTPQWQEKRKQILKRDNYRCCNCGSSSGLEVHHRQYHILKVTGSFRKPWAYSDRNLVTLCANCHKAGHKKYNIPVFKVKS